MVQCLDGLKVNSDSASRMIVFEYSAGRYILIAQGSFQISSRRERVGFECRSTDVEQHCQR